MEVAPVCTREPVDKLTPLLVLHVIGPVGGAVLFRPLPFPPVASRSILRLSLFALFIRSLGHL
jgi:hypothetical protein